jgi:hypothetical protein
MVRHKAGETPAARPTSEPRSLVETREGLSLLRPTGLTAVLDPRGSRRCNPVPRRRPRTRAGLSLAAAVVSQRHRGAELGRTVTSVGPIDTDCIVLRKSPIDTTVSGLVCSALLRAVNEHRNTPLRCGFSGCRLSGISGGPRSERRSRDEPIVSHCLEKNANYRIRIIGWSLRSV